MANPAGRAGSIEFFLLPSLKVSGHNAFGHPSFKDGLAVAGPYRRLNTAGTADGGRLHERSDTSGLNVDPVQALTIHQRTGVVSLPGVSKDETSIGGPPRFKPMTAMPHQLVKPKPAFLPGLSGANSEDKGIVGRAAPPRVGQILAVARPLGRSPVADVADQLLGTLECVHCRLECSEVQIILPDLNSVVVGAIPGEPQSGEPQTIEDGPDVRLDHLRGTARFPTGHLDDPKIPVVRTVAGKENSPPIRGPAKQEVISRMLNQRDFGTSIYWDCKDVAGVPTSMPRQVIGDETPVRGKAHPIPLKAPVQCLEHLYPEHS